MPRVGDNVYFTELGLTGWLYLTWLLCLFFSDYEYLPSISICIFSPFHFRKQSCQFKQEKKKKKKKQTTHCNVSQTYTQMPRQGVWQNPRAGRQCRHPVSFGSIPLPSTFHLHGCDIWHAGNGELCPFNGAVWAEGGEVSRPVVFKGWAPDLVF